MRRFPGRPCAGAPRRAGPGEARPGDLPSGAGCTELCRPLASRGRLPARISISVLTRERVSCLKHDRGQSAPCRLNHSIGRQPCLGPDIILGRGPAETHPVCALSNEHEQLTSIPCLGLSRNVRVLGQPSPHHERRVIIISTFAWSIWGTGRLDNPPRVPRAARGRGRTGTVWAGPPEPRRVTAGDGNPPTPLPTPAVYLRPLVWGETHHTRTASRRTLSLSDPGWADHPSALKHI